MSIIERQKSFDKHKFFNGRSVDSTSNVFFFFLLCQHCRKKFGNRKLIKLYAMLAYKFHVIVSEFDLKRFDCSSPALSWLASEEFKIWISTCFCEKKIEKCLNKKHREITRFSVIEKLKLLILQSSEAYLSNQYTNQFEDFRDFYKLSLV